MNVRTHFHRAARRAVRFFTAGLFALLLLSGGPLRAQGLVTLAVSDFEVNADGWTGTNTGGGSEPVTYKLGGATSNSAGYIGINEVNQDNVISFFVAPPKFLGDQRAAYNGFLTFYFRQNKTGNFNSGNRLVVFGSGTNFLSFDVPVIPGADWQYFALPLNEKAGWHFGTATNDTATSNQRATQEEFIRILSSLSLLRFKAEFSSNNGDQDDLDDVMLLGQPSGSPSPVATPTRVAGITIDGAVGSIYRIEYLNVNDAPTNWLTLTNIVLPTSPFLLLDPSTPSASSRSYRAVLLP